jgi:hypothetical protein
VDASAHAHWGDAINVSEFLAQQAELKRQFKQLQRWHFIEV